MRIVRFILSSVLAMVVVGLVGFVVVREALLFVATSQVKSSLSVVRRSANLIPGTPAPECQSTIQVQAESALVNVYAVQLAFQNDQEFRWELVCDSPLRDPIILSSFSLPVFVKKVPGSSGLLWREPYSTFSIKLWGRTKSFVLIDRELVVSDGIVAQSNTKQPVTACAGLGFQCCGVDSEIGSGAQATQVRDCPLTCYAQCLSRPVILSLTSQPYAEPQSRTVQITAGQEVSILYLVDAGPGRTAEVTVSFGDGENFQAKESQGTASHTYQCSAKTCRYQVGVQAVDDLGSTSAPSAISSLEVVVTGR